MMGPCFSKYLKLSQTTIFHEESQRQLELETFENYILYKW